MATVINVENSDDALANLYDRVAGGEEIVLARPEGPNLKLVIEPEKPPGGKRRFGAMRGQFTVQDSFFDPLPEEELRAWEGE